MVSGLLLPVALWQQRPATELSAVLLAAGGTLGAIYGLTRRPRLLDTAMRVDRQFGWHDLLSTVLQPSTFADAAFATILARQADAVCRRRRPNELIVRRLGSRVWGGIGIAAATVLSVSLMGTQPNESAANTPQRLDPPAIESKEEREKTNGARSQALVVSSQAAHASTDRIPSDPEEASGADPSRFGAPPTAPRHGRDVSGGSDASGSPAGRTKQAIIPQATVANRSTPSLLPDRAGVAAEGLGNPATGAGVADGIGGTLSPAPRQSVGQTTVNPTKPAQGQHLREDAALDEYREVLRGYFDDVPQ
jgi:hypothetical protein